MKTDRYICALALGQTCAWAGLFYIFPALFMRWEHAFSWSKANLTGAFTLALLLSAACSPLVGKQIDAGRGAVMMATSTLLGGLCLIGLSEVSKLSQFYLIWGLIGIAMSGCLYEPCFALVTRARGVHAKKAIILITLIAGFASTLCFPIAHILSENLGWRATLQVFAGIVILIAAPLMWLGAHHVELDGEQHRKRDTDRHLSHRSYLASPAFWLLALGFAFAALLHGITLHHLLPILHDKNIQPVIAVTAASFIGPMQIAGRLAMLALEPHASNNAIAIGCFSAMGCSVLLLMGSESIQILIVGFVMLFGGGFGITSIIRPVIALDILGERDFGAKSGSLASIYLLGSALSPWIGSVFWSLGGYQLVLQCAVIFSLVGLVLYCQAFRLSTAEPN